MRAEGNSLFPVLDLGVKIKKKFDRLGRRRILHNKILSTYKRTIFPPQINYRGEITVRTYATKRRKWKVNRSRIRITGHEEYYADLTHNK